MFTQDLYVNDKYLGSCTRDMCIIHAEQQVPYSYAWFCPECGEVWAKAIIKGQKFTVEGGYCEKHRSLSPYLVAGSMIVPWDKDFTKALFSLPEALKREFNLYLQFLESGW